MAKRAALGFKYLADDDQFIIPDERDLIGIQEDRLLTSHEKRKLSKLRCYRKHRDDYNRQRRLADSSVSRRYAAAKRFAKFRNQAWEFSQDEWEKMWKDAGWVAIPGTVSAQHPEGLVVTAYALRGTHRYKSTCMQRLDATKPWCVSNCAIFYRGEPLTPESKYYRDGQTVKQSNTPIKEQGTASTG